MSIEPRLKKEAKRDLDVFIGLIKENFPDLTISSHIMKGETISVITKVFDQHKADLVVVSSVGEHEDKNLFMASTTGGLIKQTHVPVLVVPITATYSPIKEILFAVKNTTVYDASIVNSLLKIKEDFNANTNLVKVILPESPDATAKECDLKEMADSYEEVSGDTVFESVQTYMDNNDTNLLTVIRRKRGFFERIFSSASTPQYIFDSKIPMLVLHGELDS
jgi:nucleotide-binding universal stress UspA family protein